MKTWLLQLHTHWQSRWLSFAPHSRRTIIAAAALLVAGLLWAFVYVPLESSRFANQQRISKLETQHAVMQLEAAELAPLRTIAPVAGSRVQTLADKNSLDTIFGATAKIDLSGNGQFRIVIPRMRYIDWLDRLDQTLARFRLRIVSMELNRIDSADVAVDLLLADHTRGAAK